MQVAVRPASVSRGACALAAVTVAAVNACAASCKALNKARVRQESWCQAIVRFEAAQQARFRKRYPEKVKPSGKTGQLSCLVSTFLSKAASRK